MIENDSDQPGTFEDSPRSYEDPEKGSPKRKRGQGAPRTRKAFNSQALSPSGVYPVSTTPGMYGPGAKQFSVVGVNSVSGNSSGNKECEPNIDGMSSFEGGINNMTANNMTDNSGYTDLNSQSQSQSKSAGVSFEFVPPTPASAAYATTNKGKLKGGKNTESRGKTRGAKNGSSNSNVLELGGAAKGSSDSNGNPSQLAHMYTHANNNNQSTGMDTSTEENTNSIEQSQSIEQSNSTDAHDDEQSSIFDSISRNISGVYSPPLSPSSSFYAAGK